MCVCSSFVSVSKLKAAYSKKELIGFNKATKNELAGMNAPGEILLKKNDKSQPLPVRYPQEIIKTALDGSKITTTYDSFGNKTEVRVFNGHSRLKLLMLRTSVTGQKEVYVYGHNGEVESLPENMLDKATTVSADEIASRAGITQTKPEKTQPSYSQTNQSQFIPPIQTAPLDQSSIQNQSNEAVISEEETETNSPDSNYRKQTPLPKEDSYPAVNKQTDTLDRQPKKEQ